jgi:hypothetical protein
LLIHSELPQTFFYSFDFSATAVKLVKANPKYNPATCNAFVLDIVTQDLPEFITPNSIDFVIIIFVLSAISPQHFDSIAQKLAKVGSALPPSLQLTAPRWWLLEAMSSYAIIVEATWPLLALKKVSPARR